MKKIEKLKGFSGPGNILAEGQDVPDEKEKSYELGINGLADLTEKEFEENYLSNPEHVTKKDGEHEIKTEDNSKNPPEKTPVKLRRLLEDDFGLPSEVDHSALLSGVQDQNGCNAAYAFATNTVLEGWHRKLYGDQVDLSEQELVDCSENTNGCKGGNPADALEHIIKNNISYEKDYPYVGKKQECKLRTRRLLTLVETSGSSPQKNVKGSE